MTEETLRQKLGLVLSPVHRRAVSVDDERHGRLTATKSA
jgi:hypothetical protein